MPQIFNTLYANIITDGIAVVENGYVDNLIEPTEDNQISTKFYVDNNSGVGPSGPNNSIQFSNGTSFEGSKNLTLTGETLCINGTLTNGIITLSGNQLTGLSNPINSDEAVNKNYIDEMNKLGIVSINLSASEEITYTPKQVYNNIINIDYISNNIIPAYTIDSLPSSSQMLEFLGTEFRIGKTWTTILRGPHNQNKLFVRFVKGDNLFPINVTINNFSVIVIKSVITGSEMINSKTINSYVVSHFNNVTTNTQITDRGIITPSFANGSLFETGSIIYPIPSDPEINSSLPVTYTYSDLKKILIIRTGLIADTVDTFISANELSVNGTFKFFIQNPNPFTLTLSEGLGWSFSPGNNGIIPPYHCGSFWVTVNPISCIIRSVCTNPINGQLTS